MKFTNSILLFSSALLSLSCVAAEYHLKGKQEGYGPSSGRLSDQASVTSLRQKFDGGTLQGSLQPAHTSHPKSVPHSNGLRVQEGAQQAATSSLVQGSILKKASPSNSAHKGVNPQNTDHERQLIKPTAPKQALPIRMPELEKQNGVTTNNHNSEVPKDASELYRLALQYNEQTDREGDALFVKYLGLAAELDHPDALYELGILHLKNERGIEQNYYEAARLLRIAADKDHVGALVELGSMIEVGYLDVSPDVRGAIRLYEKAMGSEFEAAYNSSMPRYLTDEKKDSWYLYRREAARRVAAYYVADSAGGGSWQISNGRNLYNKLCAVGDPESLYLLGSQTTENTFKKSEEDIRLGLKRLQQAADQDYVPAILLLGKLNERGIYPVLGPDFAKARGYYQIASDKKDVEAFNALVRLNKEYPPSK